jgi:hypothetical protein
MEFVLEMKVTGKRSRKSSFALVVEFFFSGPVTSLG